MSKEFELARRENGLTVRFLAQTLINDQVFPGQNGIRCLLQRAKRKDSDGTVTSLPIMQDTRFEYFFFFHLADFGSEDKSEIDLLLRQDQTLFSVEVKAFTNPIDSDVKREIVRNHIMLEKLSTHSKLFSKTRAVYSILLYSESENVSANPSAASYNYFNEMYLQTKGVNQKKQMTTWDSKSFEMKSVDLFSPTDWERKIHEIGGSLFFLTWRDVLNILVECNDGNRFDAVITELNGKMDTFGRTKSKALVSLI